MPLSQGQVLNNRYRVAKLLGRGGFGSVYRAWDINLDRPCAIKENIDGSPEVQRQFEREARVLGKLKHANLVGVTDFFTVPGQGQYLVMEYIDGEDLQCLLDREKQVDPARAVSWIADICGGLEYLHAQNPPIFHRDLKPANIRLTPTGKVVLVDFGLVKVLTAGRMTTQGARAVTPGFSPPEQYGAGRTDARSDVYALGATLYALLTGEPPVEAVMRLASTPLPPAHAANRAVSPKVEAVLAKALDCNPASRYQTAHDMREDLLNAVGNQRHQPAPIRAGAAPTVVSPLQTSVPAPAPQPRGKSKAWISILIICLLGLVSMIATLSAVSEYNRADDAWSRVYWTEQTATSAAEEQARVQVSERATTQANFLLRTKATQEANNQEIAALTTLQNPDLVAYGPQNGKLDHTPKDTTLPADYSGVDLTNFVAEAIFLNPYDTATKPWDYGFLFRRPAKNQSLILSVVSDGSYFVANRQEEGNISTITSGYISNLNTLANGSNRITLLCMGTTGKLYINGLFISSFDLSVRTTSGDLIIFTGWTNDHQVEGSSTPYRDFRVWKMP